VGEYLYVGFVEVGVAGGLYWAAKEDGLYWAAKEGGEEGADFVVR
jgi:hypothetical protein